MLDLSAEGITLVYPHLLKDDYLTPSVYNWIELRLKESKEAVKKFLCVLGLVIGKLQA